MLPVIISKLTEVLKGVVAFNVETSPMEAAWLLSEPVARDWSALCARGC